MKKHILLLILSTFCLFGYSQKEKTFWSLTEALVNPEQVKKLDLRKTGITEIGPEFKKFTSLEELGLRNCKIVKFPDFFQTMKIRSLDLSNTGIDEIPESIRNFKNLEKLILYDNEISHIPHWIKDLKILTEFYIGGNKNIDSLSNLTPMTWLESIDLSDLALKEIPDFIFDFNKLAYLKMTKNKIVEIPEKLNDLKELIVINFSYNKISVFPESIVLPKLEQLFLADNPLISIPPSINQMVNLIELYVSDTKIKNVPHQLFEIKTLGHINISNSKIKEDMLTKLIAQYPKIYWD